MTATYACYMNVRTKPEKREEFKRLVLQLQADVRRHESDTLTYEVLQGDDPDEFVFFECFTDEAAQQRHQQAPYHLAMSAAGWACLDGTPEIRFLRPIAP
ncbi:MAG: antibiotic biosynthesis monooxygenase [Xanthomonadales bacterium]|jgi:quinol monooxygenase YgiN|nr:antibiotic biosynthesis monooxygenase [Xanthomonadales bacterium]MCX7051388.1 putative quinol monooxygenase [Pseudomonadota bacterium]